MKKKIRIFLDFNFSPVLKKLDVSSWPAYLPTMSLFHPKLPYLSTYPKMSGKVSSTINKSYITVLSTIFKQRGLFNLLCRMMHDSNVIPYPDNLLSRHRMRLDLEQIFIWTLLFCSHITKCNEAKTIMNSPSRLHNPATGQQIILNSHLISVSIKQFHLIISFQSWWRV